MTAQGGSLLGAAVAVLEAAPTAPALCEAFAGAVAGLVERGEFAQAQALTAVFRGRRRRLSSSVASSFERVAS